MKPLYDLDKIRFATGRATFEKAVRIYESGGVRNFTDDEFGFSAEVSGSKGNFYKVYVSGKHYDDGDCDCYLGQNEVLCKHMVAVAICAVAEGGELKKEDIGYVDGPVCSGKRGELTDNEFKQVKAEITDALRYIKSYFGPSRTWFAYQNSLMEGCNRLTAVVSRLPVSLQTSKMLVDLLLRLDRKLCTGGVDDSDGTVGGFMEEVVMVLQEFARIDNACKEAFSKLKNKDTCFGWEESLLKIIDEDGV